MMRKADRIRVPGIHPSVTVAMLVTLHPPMQR
jgi:hypothetical protein